MPQNINAIQNMHLFKDCTNSIIIQTPKQHDITGPLYYYVIQSTLKDYRRIRTRKKVIKKYSLK